MVSTKRSAVEAAIANRGVNFMMEAKVSKEVSS